MKKKVYLLLIMLCIIGSMGACRGFKSAPPCPAYSSNVVPANQLQNR